MGGVPAEFKKLCDPEAWKHGGASVWVTGSFDPELNLTYWGTGNAGPDYNHEQRPGDNLYTTSVVALDADTGKLRWHYQFTPHDRYDYDAVQVPVSPTSRGRARRSRRCCGQTATAISTRSIASPENFSTPNHSSK